MKTTLSYLKMFTHKKRAVTLEGFYHGVFVVRWKERRWNKKRRNFEREYEQLQLHFDRSKKFVYWIEDLMEWVKLLIIEMPIVFLSMYVAYMLKICGVISCPNSKNSRWSLYCPCGDDCNLCGRVQCSCVKNIVY